MLHLKFQQQHILNPPWGLGTDLCASYKWDWSVMLKNKDLKREEYITGLLEVTVTEGYLTERYASIEPFFWQLLY